ncbi:hypothetical protein [Sphingomonas sp. SUN039]|uniref:hypothetical protein n=1 Tax=Sphingomonas sp. SUN039 TaxID=2937787 RepID=UPI002164EE5C|nr:hypothetical protein [Sphingomonas sp. SUN039]UVO52989.1 hypothetical protein M0209_02205 [Sphingomonas sp. SUN039]
MTQTPVDPMAMFRDAVNQWERLANEYGSKFLARPEAAQAMHSATAAGLQVQNAVQDAMAKVLSAANMPSKGEIEALGERLTRIEAALARIEAGGGNTAPATPKPTRGRKPAA